MGMEETILSLQIGKSALNFLPFLCGPKVQNQTVISSLLIVIVTDTLITGFLLSLWFSEWPLAFGLEKVSLRFLCFQNETYSCIALLVPWVCLSEEWCRSRLFRWSGLTGAEQSLSAQASLLSLTCWIFAAFCGSHIFNMQPTECSSWEWSCLFIHLNQDKIHDWLLPCTGIVLGISLSYSSLTPWDSELDTMWWRGKSFCILLTHILLGVGTLITFWFLPPFLAVSSWSVLALEGTCSIFRLQTPEPLKSVHSEDTTNASQSTGKQHI
ncbi:uncharacterized protein LOC128649224 [Bombina bombina]|uniref:uncharacterized protein LOC128649224 n=1 Tax=Bombina bombina TaxID=8345 RepID=UPI00235ABCC2|nr:uncharacterized protein LOC128649224 [Bombina bombina]